MRCEGELWAAAPKGGYCEGYMCCWASGAGWIGRGGGKSARKGDISGSSGKLRPRSASGHEVNHMDKNSMFDGGKFRQGPRSDFMRAGRA